MNKALKLLAVAVDALLLIDIASDLWQKYQARKAKKHSTGSTTKEEPIPTAEEA